MRFIPSSLLQESLRGAAAALAILIMPTGAASAQNIDAMMFPAPKAGYGRSLKGLEMIPVSGGAEIAALRLPKSGAKNAVLYFHGNAEDLGSLEKTLEEFRDKTGVAVLAIDYPGYGLSAGTATEKGCYDAADAALGYLQSKYGYKPENVVLVGRSIGTGVATDLAARKTVRGLVLISPFKSALRVVIKDGPLPFDRFENLAKIGGVKCPLLVVHGEKDEVIPFDQGRTLFDAATNASPRDFLAVPEGRHNTGLPGTKAEEYWKKLRTIVDGVKPAAPAK